MADKNIIMKEKTASGYDNLYPQPSVHADTHALAGTDPLPANAVGSSQISSNAVTPSKCDFFDNNNMFAPSGAIKLTKNVHYFDSMEALPQNPVVGQLAFVKAT